MSINTPDLPPLGLKQVNTGAAPDDGQGDTLPVAFEKHNYNMGVLAGQVAPRLTTDRTYYVSPSIGSDSNNGLLTSTPFATITKALQQVYTLNLSSYKPKIKLLDGTYTEVVTVCCNPTGENPLDKYGIYIEGNLTTPDAVSWQVNQTLGAALIVSNNATVNLQGVRFTSTNLSSTIAQYFIQVLEGGMVGINKVVFGSLSTVATQSAHIFCRRADLEILGAYSISGTARQHINLRDGYVKVVNSTGSAYSCAVSNNPAFQNFIQADRSSTIVLSLNDIAYTGSASGYQFIRDFDARVLTFNNLPNGLTAGTVNVASLGQITTPTPLANDNSTLVPTTAWVQAFVSSQLATLQALLTSQGSDLNTILANLAVIKPGFITAWGNPEAAPTGYLLCNGAEVSRNTYAALYAAIGSTYGSTSSSTFTLPDFRGRVPMGFGTGTGLTYRLPGAKLGEEAHTNTVNEMPSHFHYVTDPGHTHILGDPGHAHAIYDPGHAHGLPGQTYDTDAGEGSDGDGSAYLPLGNVTYAAATGVGVYPAPTNMTLAAAAANITFTQYTGGGIAANNIQPSLVVNFIIKT